MKKNPLLSFGARLSALSLLASLAACDGAQTAELTDEAGVSQALALRRKADLKDVNYNLRFSIPEARTEAVSGWAEIRCSTSDPQSMIIDFKAAAEQIDSVCIDGRKVDYIFKNEHISFAKGIRKGEQTIGIRFHCDDQSLNRREDFLYTLLVPDRARTLFPCFDQPDLKAHYTLSLEIPAEWEAVANGKEADCTTKGTRKTIAFAESEPISTYLFSFVAGKMYRESFTRNDRTIHIYHRETDPKKTAQCTQIAGEVFDALDWMEEYTAIPYPFAKYDLVIVPGFQFGGMEHIGATLYTDNRMFLNEQPTLQEQLARSTLIAHETTHMWYGDYVTMKWFDDVWTKEVFANFFASLITEPHFADINHRMRFLVSHFPDAYAEDRTAGSNPIKQDLDNLQNAGLVYGNIIYKKSPVVMNMLYEKLGAEAFRKGMQQYLQTYANDNASWDDLVEVLDEFTEDDLKAWSASWVNEKGMPAFAARIEGGELVVNQTDEWGRGVCWPQDMEYMLCENGKEQTVKIHFGNGQTESRAKLPEGFAEPAIIPNTDGRGYGLFAINGADLEAQWEALDRHAGTDAEDEVLRGAVLINLYENLRHGMIEGEEFRDSIIAYINAEQNPLLYSLALGYLGDCQKWYLTDSQAVERALWQIVGTQKNPANKVLAFRYYRSVATSAEAVNRLYTIWENEGAGLDFRLSEKDFMSLAYLLALHLPDRAEQIIAEQAERITQPDRQQEFAFVSRAASPSKEECDRVFESLLHPANRTVEPWASDALALLNHRLRGAESVRFIRPALEEMQEIQRTGDIFFPRAWARALLTGHTSHEAAGEVRQFFAAHPDYPLMLGNKIKQQAEHLKNK